MIRRIDLRGRTAPDYRAVVPRADFDVEAALDVVRPICAAVRSRGLEAVTEFTERFDGVPQTDIVVPPAALQTALAELRSRSRSGGCAPPARPSSSRTSPRRSCPAARSAR